MSAPRAAVAGLLTALAATVVIVAARGGDDRTRLRVELPQATGLREGTLVRVDGAVVGEIERLSLSREDEVVADLRLERGKASVRTDASVKIKTHNLLGESTIALEPGRGQPARDGHLIPASRVASNVQLDQVVDVLDGDTRARLAIAINEAGRALTGRSLHLNDLLEHLPPSLDAATDLLEQIAHDTRSIGRTVEQSDRFIRVMAKERRQLTAMVRKGGQAMSTLAGRQAHLRASLERAPTTLRTLQRFLGDLEATTRPLGQAADVLSTTAPSLRETLAQVEPFRESAEPALREVKAVSPALSSLALRATPVLRRATRSLATTAVLTETSPPLTKAVDQSVDDLVGFMEGWARAIQQRDGISHVFRGRALLSTDAIRSLLSSAGDTKKRKERKKRAPRPKPKAAPEPPSSREERPQPKLPDLSELPRLVPEVADRVGKALEQVVGGGGPAREPEQQPDVSGLLDFLLKP